MIKFSSVIDNNCIHIVILYFLGKEELLNGDYLNNFDYRRTSQSFHPAMAALRRQTDDPNVPEPGHVNYAFEVYSGADPAPGHLSYMS